jgi:hypothetical protein
MDRRYWIGVVALDHVLQAVEGGFVQVNHGKAGPLERMRPGDGFVYYSPRERHPDGPPLQQFTAIGRVCEAPLELVQEADAPPVFRRPMHFFAATPAPARPLIDALTFVRNKMHWGAAFRYGFAGVPEEDFERIARAMGRPFAEDFAPLAPRVALAPAPQEAPGAGVSYGLPAPHPAAGALR